MNNTEDFLARANIQECPGRKDLYVVYWGKWTAALTLDGYGFLSDGGTGGLGGGGDD